MANFPPVKSEPTYFNVDGPVQLGVGTVGVASDLAGALPTSDPGHFHTDNFVATGPARRRRHAGTPPESDWDS
jgi:hypothetical protein